MTEAYLVAATRTAGARRGGKFKDQHPVDLAAAVLNELLARTDADPALVEDVILGCVSQAGEQSTNVARNAVLASGLPETIPGTSIDRQCGSSQQALQFAAQAVMSGTMDVVIAGGVESMSRVPMGMPHAMPAAQGLGTYKSPRLEARYPGIQFSQFDGAEAIAETFGFTREAMDQFALDSHRKAAAATGAKRFEAEILPIDIDGVPHAIDEGIRADTSLEALGGLKTLREGGRVTAGNASQICDGASGILVVNARGLKALGVEPLARIHHMSVLGGDPVTMLDVPLAATERALKRAGMTVDDIDLFEVNEAFASVPMAWLRATGADPARLNVHGGAVALGHPLGASGTKLMTTLLYALRTHGKRYGLQTMCEGGGLANVTIVERL
ncbi:MAG: Thiolase [Rhodospirillales bacterium]|jgi:acetyl-CoA C-acetyltransferase|nr:Thiolase [Rhodospirillales bacterium]